MPAKATKRSVSKPRRQRTTKHKTSADEQRKRLEWNRSVAIQRLSDSDLYCICRAIEDDATDHIDVSYHNEGGAHFRNWDDEDSGREDFEPEKATMETFMITIIADVDLLSPLGPQLAPVLTKAAERLAKSAKGVADFEETRDLAAIAKVAKGQLKPVFTDKYNFNLVDRKGKAVPIVEREI